MFAVFEELKQAVSSEIVTLENAANRYSNKLGTRNKPEDHGGWETVSHVEENGSSNSPGGSGTIGE